MWGAILGVVSLALLKGIGDNSRIKALARYDDIINLTMQTVENNLYDYKNSKSFFNSLTKEQVVC